MVRSNKRRREKQAELDIDQLLEEYPKLELSYPLILKLLAWLLVPFAGSLLLFPWLFIQLSGDPLKEWYPALLLIPLGLLLIYPSYILAGQITVTKDSITLHRFWRHRVICFEEASKVKTGGFPRGVTIHGGGGKITIYKYIEFYPLLYEIIIDKTKQLISDPENLTPPFQLLAKRKAYIKQLLFLPVIIGAMLYAYPWIMSHQSSHNFVATVILFIGFPICVVINLLFSLAKVIYRIRFLSDRIAFMTWFGQIEINFSLITDVAVQKQYKPESAPYYDLELKLHKEELARQSRKWNPWLQLQWKDIIKLEGDSIILLSGADFHFDMKRLYDFIVTNYIRPHEMSRLSTGRIALKPPVVISRAKKHEKSLVFLFLLWLFGYTWVAFFSLVAGIVGLIALLLCSGMVGYFVWMTIRSVEFLHDTLIISNISSKIEMPSSSITDIALRKEYVRGSGEQYFLTLCLKDTSPLDRKPTSGLLERWFWKKLPRDEEGSVMITLSGDSNFDLSRVYDFILEQYFERNKREEPTPEPISLPLPVVLSMKKRKDFRFSAFIIMAFWVILFLFLRHSPDYSWLASLLFALLCLMPLFGLMTSSAFETWRKICTLKILPDRLVASNLVTQVEVATSAITNVVLREINNGEKESYLLGIFLEDKRLVNKRVTDSLLTKLFWKTLRRDNHGSVVLPLFGTDFDFDMKRLHDFLVQNYLTEEKSEKA